MNGDTLIAIIGTLALLSFGMWQALKGRFSSRRVSEAQLRQPIPDVTPEDVKRIVRRDFPDTAFEEVISIVTEYTSRWESATARVQLAALKLASGHRDSLRRWSDAAKLDYRDVLVPAEYPNTGKQLRAVCRSMRDINSLSLTENTTKIGSADSYLSICGFPACMPCRRQNRNSGMAASARLRGLCRRIG